MIHDKLHSKISYILGKKVKNINCKHRMPTVFNVRVGKETCFFAPTSLWQEGEGIRVGRKLACIDKFNN